MSRSIRKEKWFGNAGRSEKFDKRINNRMFRKKENLADDNIRKEVIHERFLDIIECDISDTVYPIKMNEVRDSCAMSKDGKSYWHDATKKDMSK